MTIPMEVHVDTNVTLDERFFGGNAEFQETFVDKVAYVQGVNEVITLPDEVTITFEDTLPGDARKRLNRFIKGLTR